MRFAACLALLVVAAAANAADPLDPTGYFFLKATPPGFTSFDWLHLWSHDGTIEGSIRLKCSSCRKGFRDRQLGEITLEGKALSFRTVDKTFSFVGVFLFDGVLSEKADGDDVILSGTLSKGKKQAPVEFVYETGD